MPGLNHTGPEGKGPRTGRKQGNCKPAPENDSAKTKMEEDSMDEYSDSGKGNRRRFRNQGENPGNFSGSNHGKFQGQGRGRGRGRGRGLGRRSGR